MTTPIFKKTAYEKFMRYHEFRRPDGTGWLNANETINGAPTVLCYAEDGEDKTATMVGSVGGAGLTRVSYEVLGGIAGKKYMYIIRVSTSNSQLFEDRVLMEVI